MAGVGNARGGAGAHDLTAGPIWGTLIAFALPTLASNVLQSLNGSINAIWVGQLLGETALAATSNANLIMFMVFALIFGFGMATTILIGQNMGRRDIAEMRRAVGAGVGLFVSVGIGVAILGWLAMPPVLRMLGTPADVYPQALEYSRVLLLGLPAGLLMVFLQFALRGTGDAMTPLFFMIPSMLIDIALNPVLILGMGPFPAMGIAGSATAGVVANYVTLLLLLGFIYLRDLPIRLRGAELRNLIPARHLMLLIVRMGVPMGLQMIVMTGGSVAMMGLVNREGTSTVAAYGAVNQLWTYIQMPAMAIGAAVSTMAAQSIGAGLWARIDRIVYAGVIINFLLTGVFLLSVTAPDRFVLGLFLRGEGEAMDVARHINLLASWSFILFGVTMVLSAAPRANGATIAPLIIMTVSIIPGRLGAAFALTPIFGADALWLSFPVGSAIALILTLAYYRYGDWRKLKLLAPPSRDEVEELVQTESEPAGRSHPAG